MSREECWECGASEPRPSNEKHTRYECGENPHEWERCKNCDQPLCDWCVEDDEHRCRSLDL